ncbi:MAG: amidohydrolase family protein [Solirubrobacteraceae bacterium]|nr:amidohydrolase family protein [Solirubrobacteraceae bacterium]
MRVAITGGLLADEGGAAPGTLLVRDGRIEAVLALGADIGPVDELIDATGLSVLPGAIDLHTHLGDMDQSDRETFFTGTRAAACGGVTTVFEHPLSDPPTLTGDDYAAKLELAARQARIDVGLWGALTPGRLDAMRDQAELGAAGFKAFTCSSGGSYPPVDLATLEAGMEIAAKLGALVLVHCEDGALVDLGAASLQAPAVPLTAERFQASRPPEVELAATLQVLELAGRTGCRLQIVHVSAPAVVDAILAARAHGVQVTFEHTPHHLLLDAAEAAQLGGAAHCAPPVRERALRDGLWARLRAGAPAIAASDHGPFRAAHKQTSGDDLRGVPLGIQGVQETPALILDACVHGDPTGGAPVGLGRAVSMLSAEPARAAGLWPRKGTLRPGADADLVLWDLATPRILDAATQQRGMHQWSPYDGRTVRATPTRVLLRGATLAVRGELSAALTGQIVRPTLAPQLPATR